MIDETTNHLNLGRAQSYYRAVGYRSIETPWLVSEMAVRATCPVGSNPLQSVGGEYLIGSAEQGFIQMMIDGKLEPGRYQSTTPCFREESSYDEMTRRWFTKTELIWYMPEDTGKSYETLVNNALSCFFEISNVETFELLQTDEGYDIMYNGIELGSYGVRQMETHLWIYGTGLAEPRFSLALRRPLIPIEQTDERSLPDAEVVGAGVDA